MAGYESRMVRGWRERLNDTAAEIRRRVWNAPALTIYYDVEISARSDRLLGHTKWFNRIFGQERAEAIADLRDLRRRKYKIQHAELTEEQREKEREAHRQWLAKKPVEWHSARREKQRIRRMNETHETRARNNEMTRKWRVRQGSEWRALEVEKKRLRVAAKPELYRAIDKRSKDRTRDARNERKRLAYKANPDKHLARKHAYYAANREQIRAKAKAAYASQKSSKL